MCVWRLAKLWVRMGDLGERFRLAWVTGGSSGIGRAIAEALDAEGVAVVATARDAGRVERRGRIVGEALELGDLGSAGGPDRLRAAIDGIVGRHGVPDLLVNNAGFGNFGFFGNQPEAMIGAQFSVLLTAPVLMTRHLLPLMRAGGGGAIVNVASLAAELPMPGFAVYNAAKAGLAQFTRSLILEGRGDGMQYLDFRPGDFRTPFNRAAGVDGRELEGDEATVWEAVERHLNGAPAPERAARCLIRGLRRGRSGTVRTGTFFQARVGAFGAKVIPFDVLGKWIQMYYGVGRRKVGKG